MKIGQYCRRYCVDYVGLLFLAHPVYLELSNSLSEIQDFVAAFVKFVYLFTVLYLCGHDNCQLQAIKSIKRKKQLHVCNLMHTLYRSKFTAAHCAVSLRQHGFVVIYDGSGLFSSYFVLYFSFVSHNHLVLQFLCPQVYPFRFCSRK